VLTVFFLGKAPAELTRENFVVEGGRRIRDVKVVKAVVERADDPELDDAVVLTVDKPGDDSLYTLRATGLEGFDPRYSALSLDFKIGCDAGADCRPERRCPEPDRPQPEIDYLAKDYASFRRLILDRLAQIAPGWTERHVPDLGVTLVELLAYAGDYLSYFQDAVATEAYLETARRRITVRRHARLVDYTLHEGCNARAFVCVQTDSNLRLERAEIEFSTGPGRETFEPLGDAPETVDLVAAHSEIPIYTWGDAECCLPAGATAATLAGELELAVGDLLLFEEVKGPRTGADADADSAHRQVVRLTAAEPGVDELYEQPIVEVAWAAADALRFPLCVSSIGLNCELIEGVSVARGNVIAVDHGRTVPDSELGGVPVVELPGPCDCRGRPGEPTVTAGPFAPVLAAHPLTFAEPLGEPGPASALLERDPRAALPQVWLTATAAEPGRPPVRWRPVAHLLAATPEDHVFVVEVDDEQTVHLRFGDGRLGAAPEPGATFAHTYRVGNGCAGNVGAEAITELALRHGELDGAKLTVSNPLPATGGTDPELVADARLLAPHVFRSRLERAVIADDYARLAERDRRLQRAAASLSWTGSWYEARVAVDPLGTEEADPALLADVQHALERYRRIGHDLAVVPARYVSIDLGLHVCALPHAIQGHVRAAVRDAVRALFAPDAQTFGTGVAASRIVAAAQAVEGVETVAVTVLNRLYEAPNGELDAGLLKIAPDEIARLDDDPTYPERGRLTLTMGGGR
jgi:hypothetical protein